MGLSSDTLCDFFPIQKALQQKCVLIAFSDSVFFLSQNAINLSNNSCESYPENPYVLLIHKNPKREKYRRFFSSTSGDDKTSRLLLYSQGGGEKPLRLPLSSGRGGDCVDFGGIGSSILIDHIWFGSSIDSDDDSALDPSIDGGDSDWRGGQIIAIGGGDAWRSSNDGSVVFDGGGGMSRADLYPRWSFGSKVTVVTASGFERKAGGGGDVWVGSVPLGEESSVLLMMMNGDLARSVFIADVGG
ncbi:hypothetical protein RchiOBHm_Chr4g0445321 [Rosa chinensis]|uniref:Uncharacterized protein n=1 Tax=Rosa chinensis TaxID=74649 RepID=A0A2P6R4C8_ROSCH|nr:hypothetical protein RchiOBHm_Chr4g0445321 [Rosa chinensis]